MDPNPTVPQPDEDLTGLPWADLPPPTDGPAGLLLWLEGDPAEAPDAACADVLAEVEADLAAAREAPAPLSPHVRAAAIGRALAGRETDPPRRAAPPAPRPASVGSTPLHGRAPRRRRHPLVRIAAVLALVLGGTWWATSGREARAGLAVAGIDRIRLAAGGPVAEPGGVLLPGARIEAGADEIVAVRLLEGQVVVLGAGGGVEVVPVPWAGLTASLKLLEGALRVRSAGVPVAFVLDGPVALELLDGEACAVGSDQTFTLALPAGARGRLLRPDRAPEVLVGPVALRFGASGGATRTPADGPAATCPDLGLALGFRAPDPAGRGVEASRWRVLGGDARRPGRRLLLSPEPGTRKARVAWRPASDVRAARRLRLLLAARPGLEVSVGPAPLAGSTVVAEGGGPVEIDLPRDWFPSLDGGEILVTFTWPDGDGAPEAVGLDGAVLLTTQAPGRARAP